MAPEDITITDFSMMVENIDQEPLYSNVDGQLEN